VVVQFVSLFSVLFVTAAGSGGDFGRFGVLLGDASSLEGVFFEVLSQDGLVFGWNKVGSIQAQQL
jgi:hypothetical protein